MASVSCPNCGTLTARQGFPVWVIIVSICLFPIGLLSLLAGRKLSTCPKCGAEFKA